MHQTTMVERISALGLDVGDRRIGIAGCDGTGLIATGLGVIHRSRNVKIDIQLLQEWIQRRDAQILVVGLPLHRDGTEGTQARKVRRFVRAVQQQIPLPVEYINEHLSTVQASWDLQEMGIRPSGQRGVIDQQAAAIILQEWLDRRKRSSSTT